MDRRNHVSTRQATKDDGDSEKLELPFWRTSTVVALLRFTPVKCKEDKILLEKRPFWWSSLHAVEVISAGESVQMLTLFKKCCFRKRKVVSRIFGLVLKIERWKLGGENICRFAEWIGNDYGVLFNREVKAWRMQTEVNSRRVRDNIEDCWKEDSCEFYRILWSIRDATVPQYKEIRCVAGTKRTVVEVSGTKTKLRTELSMRKSFISIQ